MYKATGELFGTGSIARNQFTPENRSLSVTSNRGSKYVKGFTRINLGPSSISPIQHIAAQQLSLNVVGIACGFHNSFFIVNNYSGNRSAQQRQVMLVQGDNSYGQLGISKTIKNADSPMVVNLNMLDATWKCDCVASSGSHTLVLCNRSVNTQKFLFSLLHIQASKYFVDAVIMFAS